MPFLRLPIRSSVCNLLCGLVLLCAGFVSPSAVLAQPVRSGYDFAWSDDFNGTGVDTSKWTVANTNVPTNNSLQDYLPSQVTVADGNLVITSENIASRGLPYRSGLVTSTAIQTHGRWDIRAKLPTSRGMWPAIWLLADAPWPSRGEIDIMENRGDQPTLTSSAFHYGTNPPYSHSFLSADQQAVHDSSQVNYHDSFHTYSVEWDPDQLRFYVDNVHHWTVRDSQVDGFLANQVGGMRLIINTAVGGDFLDNPDGSTQWPQKFQIDSVLAYSRNAAGPTLTFENGGFEDQGGSLAHWTTFGNRIGNVSSGHEQVKDGDEAFKLYGQFDGETNYSGIEQGLSVTAGDELIATVDTLIASYDSLVGTGNEVLLKIDYYSKLYGQFDSAEYLSSDAILLADANTITDLWTNTRLLSTVPDGAVEARLALVFVQRDNGTGAAYLDNVSLRLRSVPEPGGAPILMTGLVTCLVRRRRGRDLQA